MLLSWRGKGLWVFFFFVIWLIAGLVGGIALVDWLTSGTSKSVAEVTGVDGDVAVNVFFAAVFAMTALSVFLLDRYRKTHPQQIVDPGSQQILFAPHVDEFMWLRMGLWTYILTALTLLFVGFAYFGINAFGQ